MYYEFKKPILTFLFCFSILYSLKCFIHSTIHILPILSSPFPDWDIEFALIVQVKQIWLQKKKKSEE